MANAGTTPNLDEYFDAAFQASLDGTIDSGIQPLMGANGSPVEKTITKDGFAAMAFVTPADQVIVAYCGTDFKQISTRPVFLAHQILADYDIYQGQNPKAYADGLTFLKQAEQAAQADGLSTDPDNVFVAGHSLGGAIAEYVSAQKNLSGTTFAAPGLAPGDIPTNATADLTAYVEYGDPIGNYGNNPNYESSFLYDSDIRRFGKTTYVGDPLDRLQIQLAGQLYGGNDTEKGLGLIGFAAAAIAHHPLTDYATDLGVASPSQSNTPQITPAQLVQDIEQFLAESGSAGSQGGFGATGPGTSSFKSITSEQNADGTTSTTFYQGRFFKHRPIYAFTETSAVDGTLLSEVRYRNDGSHAVDVFASGQTIDSDERDTFNILQNSGNETFVFTPGFGQDAVNGFLAAGASHDVLSLAASDFSSIADVLRHTQQTPAGAVVTDPTSGDTVTVAGVSKAVLSQHRQDIALHA